jgi:xylulose-5-phosphate/fructose-6-phosphate phosphoketolase
MTSTLRALTGIMIKGSIDSSICMDEETFVNLFTANVPVIFAYHRYPRAIHETLHGRTNAERFHVRGYIEEGTTTIPFDMVVLDKTSRYHLCIEAVRRAPRMPDRARQELKIWNEALEEHRRYVVQHLEDLPGISQWKWTDA